MGGGHDVADKGVYIVVNKSFLCLVLLAENLISGKLYLFLLRKAFMSREKLRVLHLLGQAVKSRPLRRQAHGVYLQLRQLVRALQRPAEVLTGGIPGLAAELLQGQLTAAVHVYLMKIVLHILRLQGKGEHTHLLRKIVRARRHQGGVLLAGDIQVGGGLHILIFFCCVETERQQGRVQQHRQQQDPKVHLAHAYAADIAFFLLGLHMTINS